MKVYRSLSLGILICLASILSISCGERGHTYNTRKFIQKEYSEIRVIEDILFEGSHVGILDKLRIDFKKLIAMKKIWFHDIKYKLSDDGLAISCVSNNPIFQFANVGMKYNKVEIVLKSKIPGNLRLFWAKVNEKFKIEFSKMKIIRKSNAFRKYSIDLSHELNPGLYEYKFRIDPLDRKGDLMIKSITFYRTYNSLPSDPEKHDIKAGKVKINDEIREAFVIEPGRKVEKEFRIYKGDIFSFGISKFKINDTDCFFQVSIEQEGKGEDVFFKKKLGANDDDGWSDYKFNLGKYAGKACKITLATQPIENKKTGLVFCSNPMILSRGKSLEKPNVILISIDTLGARHLSLYGGTRNTDPFLKEWARQGVVFKNAFANSPVTHLSHGSILTGMEPLKFNIQFPWGGFGTELMDKSITLAEMLHEINYITAAFTGGVLVSERQRFDKGFELFYHEDTLYKALGKDTDIEFVLQKALKWLEEKYAAPFFLFLHSYEPHGKYYKKEDFFKCKIAEGISTGNSMCFGFKHMRGKDKIDPSEIGEYVNVWDRKGERKDSGITLADVKYIEEIYNSEIAYVDDRLKRFFSDLRRLGLLDNTIVAFTSDHGEAFFEHNLLEHGLLYDENLRIPLIFWGPGLLPSNISVDEHVSSIDIVPTILDLIGIKAPDSIDGHSLRPLMERKQGRADYKFYSFSPDNGFSWQIGNRYKFILRAKIGSENFGKKEFFDLREDPFEKKNLFDGMEKLPFALRTFAEDTIKNFPGIHISCADFAGGEFEIKLTDVSNNVYGFNFETIEISHVSGNLICKARLKRKAELVIFNNPGIKKIKLSLKPPVSNEEFLFSILIDDLDITKKQIKAQGKGKVLLAWKVKSKRQAARKRLSPEEEKKLRSLGYIH
ncbi:MAG: sulfatase [Candidatus Aminicenantes bacterium]|nr:sulfatase [Candidatus Aminicenantes bacterium]